jgi:hypothetical protein
MTRTFAIAALLAVIAILGACSGDDDQEASDARCDPQTGLATRLEQFHTANPDDRQAVIDELGDLDVPDELQPALDHLRTGLQDLTDADFDDPMTQADYLDLRQDLDTITSYLAQTCDSNQP